MEHLWYHVDVLASMGLWDPCRFEQTKSTEYFEHGEFFPKIFSEFP